MKRLLVLAMVALVACGLSPAQQSALRHQQGISAPGVTVSRVCADRMAAAFTSPNAAVPGAWACQDAALKAIATAANVNTDADIEAYASTPPQLTLTGKCPVAASASSGLIYFVYPVTTDDPQHPKGVLVIKVDADGLVNHFNLTYAATTCP